MFVYHQKVLPIAHQKHLAYEASPLTMWEGYVSKQIVFWNEVMLNMVNKTMESHVLPTFAKATTITTIFDLWMLWRKFDMFALVINNINKKWVPCHIIIWIFEVYETLRVAMALQMKDSNSHVLTCVTR
jgi:hypothetical protein